MQENKIIKYGKISAILLIFFFTISFMAEEEFYFINAVFSVGFAFLFFELFSIFIDYVQKFKKVTTDKNIVFVLIVLFFLNYIYNQSIYYAFIVTLFILWFWIFREIFKSKKARMIIIAIMILVPFIIFDCHQEFYYRITGKIVKKKVEVPAFYGIETAQSECENKMSQECKFIKWKKIGFSDAYQDCLERGETGCISCWDCGYFIVDCFYGCPKSYSE